MEQNVTIYLIVALYGVIEGLNPYAFSIALFFLTFLFHFPSRYSRWIVILSGVIFSVAKLMMRFCISLGLFENIRSHNGYLILMTGLGFFLAAALIIIGLINLHDWWVCRFKKNRERMIIKIPAIVTQTREGVLGRRQAVSFRFGIILFFSIFLAGCIAAFFESAYPGKIYFAPLFEFFSAQQLEKTAFLIIGIYNIIFMIPFFCMLLITLLTIRSKKVLCFINNQIPKIKIISAAIFLGVGSGLLFILLKS